MWRAVIWLTLGGLPLPNELVGATVVLAAEPSPVDSLVALVESPEIDPLDSGIGVAAIEAGPAALPALQTYLALPDEDERLAIAAWAIAYIGEIEAVDLLRKRLGSLSDTESRTLLAFAFASTGRPEERALLVSWLKGEHFGDDWASIVEAALSLGLLRERSAIPELSAAAQTADSIAGQAAREAIRWMEEGSWDVSTPESDLHPAIAAVIANGVPSTDRAEAFYDSNRDACWFRSGTKWTLSVRGCSDDLPTIGFDLHVSSDGLRALVSVSLVFGGLDGVGYDYIVRRSGQGWEVQGILFTWIS
jgi:hypothetical protein